MTKNSYTKLVGVIKKALEDNEGRLFARDVAEAIVERVRRAGFKIVRKRRASK